MNNFPISVSQIAEGMGNAASSLHAAGNTFEESVGLLIAANTTVQNAAKASTALRTITARIRNMKTELDDLGESFSTSKYDEIVRALSDNGASITDENGQLRDTYDILMDLSKAWATMDKNSKAALATTIAGTRTQDIFISIMDNMSEAQRAVDEMKNSSDNALKDAYSVFADTTEAKINALKNTFTKLGKDIFDSDLMKFFVDIADHVLNFADSVARLIKAAGGLKTILLSATSAMLMFKSAVVFAKGKAALSGFISLFPSVIKGVKNFVSDIKASIIVMHAYANGAKVAGGSTVAFSSAVKASIPVVGLLLAALTAVVGAFALYNSSVDENNTKIAESAREHSEKIEKIEELISAYQELYNYGGSIELDTSSIEEARNIQKDITDLVGSQAKNIDLVNGKYKEQLGLLSDIAYQNALSSVDELKSNYVLSEPGVYSGDKYDWWTYAGEWGSMIAGTVLSSSDLVNWWGNDNERMGYLSLLYNASDGSNPLFDLQDDINNKRNLFAGGNIDDIITYLGDMRSFLLGNEDSIIQSGVSKEAYKNLLRDIDARFQFYNGQRDTWNNARGEYYQAQAIIDSYEAGINSQNSFDLEYGKYRNTFGNEDSYRVYYKRFLENNFPEYYSKYIENDNNNNNVKSGLTDVQKGYSVNIDALKKLSSAYKVAKEAEEEFNSTGNLSIDTVGKLSEELEDSGKSIDEFLINGSDGKIKLDSSSWKEYFDGLFLGEDGINGLSEIEKALYDSIVNPDEYDGKSISEKINEYKTSVEIGKEAYEDSLKYSKITEGTYTKLLDAVGGSQEELDKYLIVENDNLKLNVEAWNKRSEAIIGSGNIKFHLFNAFNEKLLELQNDELYAEAYRLSKKFDEITNGNVIYEDRPIVFGYDMREKYPEYGFSDSDMSTLFYGEQTIGAGENSFDIMFTPILQDGTVLDADGMQDYLSNLIVDEGVQGVLNSDNNNLIIHIAPSGLGDEYWDPIRDQINQIKDDVADQVWGWIDHFNLGNSLNSTDGVIRSVPSKLWQKGFGLYKTQYQQTEQAVNDINSLLDKTDLELVDIIKQYNDMKRISQQKIIYDISVRLSGLDSIEEIYNDVANGGRFDFASLLSEDFVDSFSVYDEEYSAFINTIVDSPDDINACKDAFNDLAGAYISGSGALDDLNESNRNTTIAMLESKGIANATEIVDRELAVRKERLALETGEYAEKTFEEAIALGNEANVSAVARQALLDLAIAKFNAKRQDLQTGKDIQALLNLADAAGVTTQSMKTLIAAKDAFDDYERLSELADTMEGTALGSIYKTMAKGVYNLAMSLFDTPVNYKTYSSGFVYSPTADDNQGKTGKTADEYKVEIEKYRMETSALKKAQKDRADAERALNNETDSNERIQRERELIETYKDEQDALHNLNEARRVDINSNIKALEDLGFVIDYDSDKNTLLIENLELINDATTNTSHLSQEELNAWRKDVEKLIDDTQGLVDANAENSDEWLKLSDSIGSSKDNIVKDFDEIVEEAANLNEAFKNVYDTLRSAAVEYAQNGFVGVETLREILDLEPKYLKYLYDENGQLVINEKSIQDVIKAKTEALGAETALAYARKILEAVENGEIETVRELTIASEENAESTWDQVDAVLSLARAIGISKNMPTDMFDNAYDSIAKIRKLTSAAAENIGEYFDSLKDGYVSQKEGIDTIISLTEDLIRHEMDDQVEALENQKTEYEKIIEDKKRIIDLSKKENDHEKDIEKKLKEIAKLQARIDKLSLDDSREARAERAKLEEELSEKQMDLADTQSEYAIDAQKELLDNELRSYEDEKDAEIKELNDTMKSTEQIYRLAVERITNEWEGNWEGFYQTLISWNLSYGSTLESDLTSAWNAATAAAQRYGGVVEAIEGVKNDTVVSNSTGGKYSPDSIISQMKSNSLRWLVDNDNRDSLEEQNRSLASDYTNMTGAALYWNKYSGRWEYPDGHESDGFDANGNQLYKTKYTPLYSLTNEEKAKYIVGIMKQNSNMWSSASENQKKDLEDENYRLANVLREEAGVNAIRDEDSGIWYIDRIKGAQLYERYHTGGIVGGISSLKQDETIAVLQDGEMVLDKKKENALYKIVDFAEVISKKVGSVVDTSVFNKIFGTTASLPKISTEINHMPYANEVTDFHPVVNVYVEHGGSFNDSDAKRFGGIAADTTLQVLKDAFGKRGISSPISAL